MEINPAVTNGLGQLKWVSLKSATDKSSSANETKDRARQPLNLQQCFKLYLLTRLMAGIQTS